MQGTPVRGMKAKHIEPGERYMVRLDPKRQKRRFMGVGTATVVDKQGNEIICLMQSGGREVTISVMASDVICRPEDFAMLREWQCSARLDKGTCEVIQGGRVVIQPGTMPPRNAWAEERADRRAQHRRVATRIIR